MPMKPWPDERIVSPVDVDVDIVPMREFAADHGARDGIVRHQILDRLVGEDDAPAERVVGAVALEQVDLVRGSRSFIEIAK
jgi:hypothetical protein